MKLQHFLELRDMLTVAHHIPGRLRLKLDPRIREHPAATALEKLGQNRQDTGLLSARINPLARSLLLEYDLTRITFSDLEEFLKSADENRVSDLATSIAKLFGIDLQLQKENSI